MRLSNFELDIMAYFWEGPELTAPEVFKSLGQERGVTYSTIKALIDRLETKGALVRTRNEGRTIYYKSAVARDKVRRPLVKSFLRRVYGDDLRPLFAQLLRDRSLSEEELAYLRRLLDQSTRSPK
ncbi:MAG TPA: BlaI/MecI/CopY family transcriptional regulator [Steroidobacteraceae bacterium]